MSAFLRHRFSYVLSFLVLPVIVASCGGSGNDPVQLPGQAPMTDHAAVTMVRGVVTSAHPDSNTILVGDDEVVIADATITENGAVTRHAAPKVGETVTLSVTRDPNGERFVAQAIDVSVVALGPVGVVNLALNNFSILGQTVSYTPSTVIGIPAGGTLTSGMMVKVSGTVGASGVLNATKVEYVAASYTNGQQLQVAGLIQSLNAGTRTFTLGALSVSYASVLAVPALTNNMQVFVGATSLPVANGALIAAEISTGALPGTPTGNIEAGIALKGAIEAVNLNGNTFTVLGQTVSFNPATTSFPSNQISTLVLNYVVKVTATPSTIPGQWNATRVELVSTSYVPGNPIQVSGTVQNVNATLRTFTIGALTVNYATVPNLAFTPTTGMAVIAAATTAPNAGTFNATELRAGTVTTPTTPVSNIDPTAAIRGPIESVNIVGNTFNVMGQTVTFNPATTLFPNTQANTLVNNYVVKVTATPSTIAGQWTATRVDLVGTGYVPGTAVQVSGTVQNVNTLSRTFSLGTLTVNYASATGMTFTPTAGMSVIVGAVSTPSGGLLNATEVVASTTTIPGNPGTPTGNIDLTATIKGPIEFVNTGTSTFNVMGQTVSYNALTTTFPQGQPNTLVQNYVVRVVATPSGIAGQWTATRVDLVGTGYVPGTAVQVSGTVQNVNTLSRTFSLGTLTVNYASATGMTFTPTAGMSVIVGAVSTPSGGLLNATEVVASTTTIPGNPGTPTGNIDLTATIKGPIEFVNTGTSTFNVMGQTVSYNALTTTFPQGQPNTLVQNYVVRVVATPSGIAGQWTATRVDLVGTSFVPGTAVQVSGTVQNVNTLSRTFSLGTLTVNYASATGMTFTPTAGMSVIVGAVSTPSGGLLNATEVVASTTTVPGIPGTPATIDFTASIKGPVDIVNPLGSSFTVLGQTVTFNGSTQFVTPAGTTFVLTAGNVVKVTTTPSTVPGQLIATRVELVSTNYTLGTPVQVTGIAQNVNTLQRTFNLGTLTVSYTGVTNLLFTPTNGMTVVVAATTLPVGNLFNATAMASSGTTIPGFPGTPVTPPTQPTFAVVTGTISTVLSATEFNLTGVTVRINPTTVFSNGSQAMLLPGISIMVTGSLSGGLPNAILDATMIRFSGAPIAGASRIQIRGPIEFVDIVNRRLSVLGIAVNLPPSSIFVRDDDPDHSVNLANLRPGQVVTVSGVGTNRQINATFLAVARGDGRPRDSDEDDEFQSRLPTIGVPLTGGLPNVGVTGVRAWLWAPLDAVQAPMLSAFGIPVTTTASTAFFPAGHNTRASSPTTFFGTATTGRTVRVEGVYANGTFVASRVCIVNSLRGSDFTNGSDGDNDD